LGYLNYGYRDGGKSRGRGVLRSPWDLEHLRRVLFLKRGGIRGTRLSRIQQVGVTEEEGPFSLQLPKLSLRGLQFRDVGGTSSHGTLEFSIRKGGGIVGLMERG